MNTDDTSGLQVVAETPVTSGVRNMFQKPEGQPYTCYVYVPNSIVLDENGDGLLAGANDLNLVADWPSVQHYFPPGWWQRRSRYMRAWKLVPPLMESKKVLSLAEMRHRAVIEFSQALTLVKLQRDGRNGLLGTNDVRNVLFVRDAHEEICQVSLEWMSESGLLRSCWHMEVCSVADPEACVVDSDLVITNCFGV